MGRERSRKNRSFWRGLNARLSTLWPNSGKADSSALRHATAPCFAHRLRLEPLEDRRMLTVFLVDSLEDTVADDGVTTLREALQAANTNTALWGGDVPAGTATETDIIRFDPSLFTDGENPVPGTITLGGTQLEITDTAGITIEGPGAELLAIDADGRSRVFYVGNNAAAELSGMTITGGKANEGGGIHSSYGKLTVVDSIVEENTAVYGGGGIYSSPEGELFVVRSFIVNNSSIDGSGGGLLTHHGPLSVLDSTVSGNVAKNHGGGISTRSGDGIIANSNISNNSTGLSGAGIYSSSTGTLSLVNSNVADNLCQQYGGGVYQSRNVFSIVNSTIVGNSATLSGGGIYKVTNISGVKVIANNSIVALNQSTGPADVSSLFDTGSSFNFVGVWSGSPAGPSPNSIWGTPAAPLDPMLTVVLNDQAQTVYCRPRPGSPVINAGSNALAVDAGGDPLTSDLLGNPRIHGGTVDMGAVETTDSVELVVVPTPRISLVEGESTEVLVSLSAAPDSPVIVSIVKHSDSSDEVNSDLTTIAFDETNWDTAQVITVSSNQDDDIAHETALFSFSTTGMDTVRIEVLVFDDDPQVYLVNSLADVVADDGFLTLREALEAANTNTAVFDAPAGSDIHADIIRFDPALFTDGENPVPGRITLDGTQLEITDSLVIEGPGPDLLTIDADGKTRVFYINSPITVDIEGLTITGGGGTSGSGGGIFTDHAETTVFFSSIESNATYNYGGGIYSGNNGSLTVNHSVIKDNTARFAGGGMYLAGTASISNTIIEANSTESEEGGGGGIFNGARTTLVDSTIVGNMTKGPGGGITNQFRLWVDGTTISENRGLDGGGIYNNSDAMRIANSTITANSAMNMGGGVYTVRTVEVTNTTIARNTAGVGGGVYAFNRLTLRNSIVAANHAATANSDIRITDEGVYYCSNNLVGIWDNGVPPGPNSVWGTPAEPLAPRLTAITNEDGNILFYRPHADSPAVDAGDNALAVDTDGNPLTTDILGNARIVNGTVDLGSVELATWPELAVTMTPEIELNEGDTCVVHVSLTASPSAPTTVTIAKRDGDTDSVTADATTLVFDETNWDIPQPVEVAAVVDADPYHELVVFSFAAEGMDTVRIRVTAVDEVSRPYVVNSLEDIVALDGILTLREAIEAANTNKAVGDAWAGSSRFVDVITFAPELAGGTIVLSGMQLEILDDLVIQGIGADQLAVSGNNASRVFHIGKGVTATIDGLEITEGWARTVAGDDFSKRGGGVFNEGVLTLANVRLSENRADSVGGGVYNTSTGTLSILTSTIIGNSAVGAGGGVGNCSGIEQGTGKTMINGSTIEANSAGAGGGIYNYGTILVENSIIARNSAVGAEGGGGGIRSDDLNPNHGSTATILSSLIIDNNSVYHGGGVYLYSGTMTLTDSTVSRNSAAARGGGINNWRGTLTVANSTISDNVAASGGGCFNDEGFVAIADTEVTRNVASSGGGGGILNRRSLTVVRSVLARNHAMNSGGAVANTYVGDAHFTDSSIVDNMAFNDGAGIHASGDRSQKITIVNSTIGGNAARARGGAVYIEAKASLHLTNTTIVDNSAKLVGGGIYLTGSLSVWANTVVAGNHAESGIDCFLDPTGTPSVNDFNLIGIWEGATVPAENTAWGTLESPLDPMLARITDATGLILHYRPLSTSPAVNAGSNALAVDPEGNPLATDALGGTRFVGAAVDIGAVEWSSQPHIGVLPLSTTNLIEGETVDVQVVLTAPPSEAVTVQVDQEPASGVGIVTKLTFSPNNWNVPQTITIVAREDDDRRNESVLFSFTGTGFDPVCLPVTVKDNDPQVYVVNSLEDIVAEDGLLTLREALEAANTNRAVGDAPAGCEGFADIIEFAPELFTEGAEPVARAIVLGGGQLELLDNVEIRGPGADLLTIDADSLSRVFYVGSSISVAIDGLRITGGSAQDTDPGDANDSNGGGIYLDRQALLGLTNSTVMGNTAARYGGGIFAQAFCTISIADSTIANNAAFNCGGIHSGGGSVMSITRSTISGNVKGGIANNAGSKLVISDSTISHNTAGGIANSYPSTLVVVGSVVSSNSGSGIINGATLTVAASIIVDNSAENGAGIYNADQGTATISGSTISRNMATSYGGGVYNAGTMDIIDSNLSENEAAYGGGASANGSGVVTLSNTLVENNTASTHGGGIYVRPGCEAILIDSPVAGNAAPRGGGVYNWGRTTVDGSSFTGNTATYGGGIFSRAVLTLDNSELADNSATYGGGFYADEPSMITITSSAFGQNSATTSGGAIHSVAKNYPINITDSIFLQNSAPNGGGVYNDQGSVNLTGSTFERNASTTSGGGVFNKQGTLTVANSTFTANTSNNLGGAIHNEPNGTTNVTGSTFLDNSALNRAGAVYNLGTLAVADSIFLGNSATASNSFGGAVSNYNGATAQITGSTFHGNVAGYGAAIFGFQDTTVTVANSAISGNYARSSGGGLFSHGSAVLTVVNSTVAGNAAGQNGGGIFSYTNCQLTLQNSIVALNNAVTMPDIVGDVTTESSHNQIGGQPRFLRNPSDGGDGWGDNLLTPEVDESANDDYGDLRLRFDSPAINAGSNALAIGPDGSPLAVDVAEQPRIVYDTVDLGAYEFQAVTLQGDANGDNAVNELDAAILARNWGKTGMSWADGDFNDDGVVNAIDAATLAAHFGTTFTPPTGEAAAPAMAPAEGATDWAACSPFVGPMPDVNPFSSGQPIAPANRRTQLGRENGLFEQTREGQGNGQIAYGPGSPAGLVDSVFAEEFGMPAEQAALVRRSLAWASTVARRAGQQPDANETEAALAVDLLLARRQ